MVATLQATTVLRMIIRSFSLYFSMLPTLFGLLVIFMVLPLLLLMAGVALLAVEELLGGILLVIVGMVTLFVAFFYYSAAATVAVSVRLTGARSGILQILRRLGGNLAGQIIGTSFQAGLRILGGLLLLIIPGLVFMVRYMLISPVVVLERTPYGGALERSKQLVSGHGWRLVGGLVLLWLVNVIVQTCAGFFLILAGDLVGLPFGLPKLLGQLAGFVFFPVSIVFPVFFYYDMRIRKEALNLETIQEIV